MAYDKGFVIYSILQFLTGNHVMTNEFEVVRSWAFI